MHYAKPLAKLVAEFEKLPGIGPKSAQRLAFHILRIPEDEAQSLAQAVISVKQLIKLCPVCYNFTDQDRCEICSDAKRDRSLCASWQSRATWSRWRKPTSFEGCITCLGGVISPMDGVGPEMLKIRELLVRVNEGEIKEIVLATNPTIEGDTTAMYIAGLSKTRLGMRSRLRE